MLFALLLVVTGFSCRRDPVDDLDIIKKYRPEDKYFKAGMVSLHFMRETSSIGEVDSTYRQMIQRYDLPVSAEGCPDGVFWGRSPYDTYDYQHTVKLEIRDGQFVEVDYNEIKKDGIGKQEDEAYCEEMSVMGTTPAIAYPKLEKQLLEKQNLMHVDAVSGATYSLYRYRYAVMVALMKAKIQEMKDE